MKKVLVVAYYFPPSGGPGVQRVLKHIKYLPDFGYEPIVLTVENGHFPAIDESLLEQIPKDLKIVRAKIFEPYSIYRKFVKKGDSVAIDVNNIKKDDQKRNFKESLAEFVRATFFIPDARAFWRSEATKAGMKAIEDYDIDAIYSSSPPYTCSLIARDLAWKYKLPWIAGFRDPWTGFLTSPKRWFLPAAIDRSFERSVFSNALAVECAWKGIAKDAMKKYPELDESKFFWAPNGFDSNDFPKIEAKRNEKFTIAHSGSLYGRRNPAAFFSALENLIKKGALKKDDFIVRFVGRAGAEVEEMFNKASFKDSIEVVSYVPHKKSLELLLSSDALLLIVDEAKESEEIVPGKVYEYIGSGKPTLATAPRKSAIADLLEETSAGEIAHQSEIERIEEIFMKYYNAWKAGKALFSPNLEAVARYERRNSARILAEKLDFFLKDKNKAK